MKTLNEWRKDKNTKTITITCRDVDNTLQELIEFIKKNGNGGHTFSIVADGKKFEWDGDGSDAIFQIEVESNRDISD